jgi:hypothetical protein
VVECLTLVLHIRKVMVSNLGPETGYPYRFFVILLSIHANSGILPYIRTRPLNSTTFPIYHSLVALLFDAV